MLRIIQTKFPQFSIEDFEEIISDFFNSDDQLEDYLSKVVDLNLREFALSLSEKSASQDGLDPRENLALMKVKSLWGSGCE